MYPANLTENSFAKTITPILISVFAVYLTIGMTLGVLPGFVKNDLHFDSLGIVAGWYNYQAVYMLGVLSCILALFILFLKRDR